MPTSPTLLLRKQRHWPIVWKTEVEFEPKATRTEAGTVVWWNYLCFASIGIRLGSNGSQTQRVVRFTPPANTDEYTEEPIGTHGRVKFIVDCTEKNYRFGFKELDADGRGEWKWLGAVDTQVMTRNPEIGQPFTGMMLGLYSFGELQPALAPAYFSYAEFGEHLD